MLLLIPRRHFYVDRSAFMFALLFAFVFGLVHMFSWGSHCAIVLLVMFSIALMLAWSSF